MRDSVLQEKDVASETRAYSRKTVSNQKKCMFCWQETREISKQNSVSASYRINVENNLDMQTGVR